VKASISERRRHNGRLKTFLIATIADDDGRILSDCVIIDLSDSGARIFVQDGESLPNRFQLKTRRREIDMRCKIIRRDSETVGVEFVRKQHRLA
jgi:hypothetical protein